MIPFALQASSVLNTRFFPLCEQLKKKKKLLKHDTICSGYTKHLKEQPLLGHFQRIQPFPSYFSTLLPPVPTVVSLTPHLAQRPRAWAPQSSLLPGHLVAAWCPPAPLCPQLLPRTEERPHLLASSASPFGLDFQSRRNSHCSYAPRSRLSAQQPRKQRNKT